MTISLTLPSTGGTGWDVPINNNFTTIQGALNNGMVKAWVNFNGSTAVINSSFNVSGVTRNSASDFTITFSTAMASAAYLVLGHSRFADSGTGRTFSVSTTARQAPPQRASTMWDSMGFSMTRSQSKSPLSD